MLKHKITNYKDIVMVGKVFKQGGINLLYGESGLGKTVSTIKALNDDEIEPILLDFDENLSPEQSDCKFIHIDGNKFMKDEEAIVPENQTIIVDTWQIYSLCGGSYELLARMKSNSNTVIVIAHNKDIATKTDIPDIDSRIANHMDAKLFMEYDKGNKSKTNNRDEGPKLTVKKLRGYTGSRTIYNWMRDDCNMIPQH